MSRTQIIRAYLISETASAELDKPDFQLSWSHYQMLAKPIVIFLFEMATPLTHKCMINIQTLFSRYFGLFNRKDCIGLKKMLALRCFIELFYLFKVIPMKVSFKNLCTMLALTSAFSVAAQKSKTPQKPSKPMVKNEDMATKQVANATPRKDPMGVQVHTLKNGLKVYFSLFKDAPRVQTLIAVRAGSKNDPSDATGLAHYLEHMLFKGTSKMGAMNWKEEGPLLKQISDLYEKYRAEKDMAKRKEIYAEIDKISLEASKFVSTNEYDRMISSLGAKGTNAFTSLERTVYVNDIPSNQLEKWLTVESERMRELTLRLFHTELEAVYEEFNIGQDNDSRKIYYKTMELLFPSHTYGTQTTIGTSDHLKNPSMVKIHEYFKKYYVPNNMAIIIAGDFDPVKTLAQIESKFGGYKNVAVPNWKVAPQPEIKAPIKAEVFGLEKSGVQVSWRTAGINTDDALLAELTRGILFNGQAGLMDLDLIQKQKIGPESDAGFMGLKDYGVMMLYAEPREGQKLEEVEALLVEQMQRIAKGDFEDYLIKAVIKDFKLGEIKRLESNQGRAFKMLDAFIFDQEWAQTLQKWARMEKFTKQDIMNFVKKNFAPSNYVAVYKREGENKNKAKVDKPQITPVQVNRSAETEFKKNFDKIKAEEAKPEFLNFNELIKSNKVKGNIPFQYLKNPNNETFSLYYVLEMGKNHDKMLPLAVDYLPLIGTTKYSAAQLQKEFFKLGLYFSVNSSNDRCYITLGGLDESFEEGVKLFEHILGNAVADPKAWENKRSDILKNREDLKKDKSVILRQAMANFAQYGNKSPFSDVLSAQVLEQTKAETLVDIIKKLNSYEHKIFYYGSQTTQPVEAILTKYHNAPAQLLPIPAETAYNEVDMKENEVLVMDFPSVQTEILMLSKGTNKFDMNEFIMSQIYNDYFGGGLSSIVFQEIRESKALAYSASAGYSSPSFADKAHYLRAYLGTQSDKMKEAITAMGEIIENMPISEKAIENAWVGIQKKIETERITKENVYWSYLANMRRGYNEDLRKRVYDYFKGQPNLAAVTAALKDFQQTKVKGRKYTYLVLGDKKKIDMEYLSKLGKVRDVSLNEVFGY